MEENTGIEKKDAAEAGEKIFVSTEEKLKEIVTQVNESDISSIKSTVSAIIQVINDPKSSAKDLKPIIEVDPPLTAKMLRLANSAFYGYPKTINDIQEAVVCIGFDAIKELALSQKVSELFNQDDPFAGYSRAVLWKHSIAVGLCGKLLYQKLLKEKGDNIYVTGLLHDIGIIVEDQFLLSEFYYVLDNTGPGKANFPEVERATMGYDHSDIGRAVAEDWQFPDELSAAIGRHHNPDEVAEEFAKITSALYIANFVCQSRGIGYCDAPNKDYKQFENCRKKLNALSKVNITEKMIDGIIDEVQDNIRKMEKAGWI